RVVLDENISLEGEPRRKVRERFAKCLSHFVVIRCAFHHVSMGVPRVAIRASKRASDIRVDGPVAHPCSFRSVQNTLRRRAVVANVFLNVENRQSSGVSFECFSEKCDLVEPISLRRLFPDATHTRIYTEAK